MTSYYVESLTVFTISARISAHLFSRKPIAVLALALACWLFGTSANRPGSGQKDHPVYSRFL
jgi:hypothetical protein